MNIEYVVCIQFFGEMDKNGSMTWIVFGDIIELAIFIARPV